MASDYPPVAKAMAGRLMDDDYSPDEIYSFYDEPISSEQAADTVRFLATPLDSATRSRLRTRTCGVGCESG